MTLYCNCNVFVLQGSKQTTTYLLEILVRLQPINEELECEILQKLISTLTHQTMTSSQPLSASNQDMRASVNTLAEMTDLEKHKLFE